MDRAELTRLLRSALAAEHAPDGDVSLAFVGDRAMQRINRDFRDVDRSTDVLSFSYLDEPHAGGVLGEIYISPAVATRQAEEAGCDLGEEIARLSLHGLLHILGYVHDTSASHRRMMTRQERYLDQWGRDS